MAVDAVRCGIKYKTGAFPKDCACGRTYLKEMWRELPFAYLQENVRPSGVRYYDDLEARHCTCGSTIAVKVEI